MSMSENNIQSRVKEVVANFNAEYLKYVHPALFLTIREGYEITNIRSFIKIMLDSNIVSILNFYDNTNKEYKNIIHSHDFKNGLTPLSDDIGATYMGVVYSKHLDSFVEIDWDKRLCPHYVLENGEIIELLEEESFCKFLPLLDFNISPDIIDKMVADKIISEKCVLYCH